MLLIPFIAAFFMLILFFLYLNYSLSLKRALYVRKMRPYRSQWDRELEKSIDYYSSLSLDGRSLFLDKISIFINEKIWPDDLSLERKLSISSMACLPVIFRKSNFYPYVEKSFISYTQKDWLAFHEIQFEKEIGKMQLREFEGHFIKHSITYLKDPTVFKRQDERLFKLLNYYYKFLN